MSHPPIQSTVEWIRRNRLPSPAPFQVGIASKYFGPIILSINHMMKDVLLFLITFAVIMLAFACGVSYIFNMAEGERTREG